MTTLMERGMSMLGREIPKVAGGQIVYQRGESRVWIDAAFGVTEFQVEDSGGVRIEHSDRDFIFAMAGLILDGTIATPQRGDRITIVEDGGVDGQVFEVLAPGGAQVYRLCDAFGQMIRVHTKKLQ